MRKLLSILLSLIFFATAFAVISDYNVNWDEPDHFVRGQAYLRYLFTGKTNYNDLPKFREFQQALQGNVRNKLNVLPRYSIYQSAALDAAYHLKNDNGHPPLNGILASLTNYLLYQRLGVLGDIESYHFFIIAMASLAVFLVVYWAMEQFGIFAGLVSFLSLGLYPFFIAESHNNIKDPVETAFFTLFLYSFYKGVTRRRWIWIVVSGLAAGLAFGTKWNILFAPFIVFLWLIGVYGHQIVKSPRRLFRSFLSKVPLVVSLVSVPLIAGGIFFLSWPFLWGHPVQNFFKIVSYYQQVGTGMWVPKEFLIGGFNTYPVLWIFYTTPPIILFYLFLGLVASLLLMRVDTYKTTFLWLLWFIVPIFRVSIPGVSIYGGVRQIMEFVPAMALLSGLGATYIVSWLCDFIVRKFKHRNNDTMKRWRRVFYGAVILSFLPIAVTIVKIHPNENLYFNTFIGGLPGAAGRNFPGWGSTLGNPYIQGVIWLNKNAESDAKLTLALGLMTTIPPTKIRPDITYDNSLKSVTWREGEYIMDLTYYGFPKPYYDAVYPERYLIPVHQVVVEGVPILNIWKNDTAHTKPGFVREEDITALSHLIVNDESLMIDMVKPRYVTKIELSFNPKRCILDKSASIFTASDDHTWIKEPEGLFDEQIPRIRKNPENGKITHLLAAVPARHLKIVGFKEDSCPSDALQMKLFALLDIVP